MIRFGSKLHPVGRRIPLMIKVVDTIGKPPQFWDRNVVFVANLMGLFFENEEETQMLADAVGEVDSYGGRLLPMLDLVYRGDGRNHLILERGPDPALSGYFLESGLTLPETSILPHREYLKWGEKMGDEKLANGSAGIFGRIAEHPASYLDGYVTDEILCDLAAWAEKPTCSTSQGSRKGNNKVLLHQHLESVGLPTPGTELAESPRDVRRCLESLEKSGYTSAVIRAPIGASGIGMVKVDSLAQEKEVAVPEHFFGEGACLVQGWLREGEFGVTGVCSPSVQLFLGETEVRLFDMTEQILSSDSIHEGNESPPFYLSQHEGLQEELLRQAGIAGEWLHSQGYRGTGSVDFLITFDSEGWTVYVCEINARVTGATYPSVLARHFLPEGAWLLRNLRFHEPLPGEELLELMRSSGDLFLPGESDFGIFPVNFNFGKDGLVHKGQFLCLSASRLSNKMLLRVAELDLPCTPERD